jgi:hypothetical protein
MSARGFSLAGTRRLVLGGLALVGLVAVVAVLLVAVSPFGARVAHGGGTGGGGCVSTSGPVCHFQNNFAFADFGSVSSDGCIFTDASVQTFQSLTRPGNITSQAVIVSVNKFDFCQGTQLESASNIDPTTFLPDFTGTFQMDTQLKTATAAGTAPLFDNTSGALLFTTTIQVTWQGFGATTHSIDSSHFHGLGFIMNSHFNGDSRAAEASGTFTDETGANLATLPTLGADLSNVTSGTVQIIKS